MTTETHLSPCSFTESVSGDALQSSSQHVNSTPLKDGTTFERKSSEIYAKILRTSSDASSSDGPTTIVIFGLPEDMAAREFLNLFTFATGFENAALERLPLSQGSSQNTLQHLRSEGLVEGELESLLADRFQRAYQNTGFTISSTPTSSSSTLPSSGASSKGRSSPENEKVIVVDQKPLKMEVKGSTSATDAYHSYRDSGVVSSPHALNEISQSIVKEVEASLERCGSKQFTSTEVTNAVTSPSSSATRLVGIATFRTLRAADAACLTLTGSDLNHFEVTTTIQGRRVPRSMSSLQFGTNSNGSFLRSREELLGSKPQKAPGPILTSRPSLIGLSSYSSVLPPVPHSNSASGIVHGSILRAQGPLSAPTMSLSGSMPDLYSAAQGSLSAVESGTVSRLGASSVHPTTSRFSEKYDPFGFSAFTTNPVSSLHNLTASAEDNSSIVDHSRPRKQSTILLNASGDLTPSALSMAAVQDALDPVAKMCAVAAANSTSGGTQASNALFDRHSLSSSLSTLNVSSAVVGGSAVDDLELPPPTASSTGLSMGLQQQEQQQQQQLDLYRFMAMSSSNAPTPFEPLMHRSHSDELFASSSHFRPSRSQSISPDMSAALDLTTATEAYMYDLNMQQQQQAMEQLHSGSNNVGLNGNAHPYDPFYNHNHSAAGGGNVSYDDPYASAAGYPVHSHLHSHSQQSLMQSAASLCLANNNLTGIPLPSAGGTFRNTLGGVAHTENPPCNTLYVGNLPPNASEEELRRLFSKCDGFKRLSFRVKANGPMCFVEFHDIGYATQAMHELHGTPLASSNKGGIRLSFSKNPLGVRSTLPPVPSMLQLNHVLPMHMNDLAINGLVASNSATTPLTSSTSYHPSGIHDPLFSCYHPSSAAAAALSQQQQPPLFHHSTSAAAHLNRSAAAMQQI